MCSFTLFLYLFDCKLLFLFVSLKIKARKYPYTISIWFTLSSFLKFIFSIYNMLMVFYILELRN